MLVQLVRKYNAPRTGILESKTISGFMRPWLRGNELHHQKPYHIVTNLFTHADTRTRGQQSRSTREKSTKRRRLSSLRKGAIPLWRSTTSPLTIVQSTRQLPRYNEFIQSKHNTCYDGTARAFLRQWFK